MPIVLITCRRAMSMMLTTFTSIQPVSTRNGTISKFASRWVTSACRPSGVTHKPRRLFAPRRSGISAVSNESVSMSVTAGAISPAKS